MTLRLNGSTSGYTEIDAPAAAGSNTLVLPSGNGSANQFLKNGSTAGTLGWSSMVEDSSGRVLVGTSSTSATALLTVQGSSSTATGAANINIQRGTAATSIVADNVIGQINFGDSSANAFANISCSADATAGTNDYPGRLTFATTADGASSPTERARITNAGFFKATNSASYRNANDNYFEFLSDKSGNVVLHVTATNGSFAEGILFLNAHRAATSSYAFLDCRSGNDADREFYLRGDGQAYADQSWNGGGADYAEYFEWFDANPNEEDRRGISVVLDGDKIREAVAGEDPIGVISGNPSVVGDAAWNKWSGKYLRDEFGTYLLDENGERQLNSAYDPDQEYIPREQRSEWDCVGLMGKLRIRKGQVTGSRWIKMRDISDSVEEWLVR